MDQQTFASLLQPAADYFNWTLDDDLLRIYFEELGGCTEKRLAAAVRDHIANSRFRPKIADLKKRLGMEPGVDNGSKGPTDLERRRHWEVSDRMLQARIEGRVLNTQETTLFPVEPLVEQAYEHYQSFTDKVTERTKRSYAFGLLNKLVTDALAEATR